MILFSGFSILFCLISLGLRLLLVVAAQWDCNEDHENKENACDQESGSEVLHQESDVLDEWLEAGSLGRTICDVLCEVEERLLTEARAFVFFFNVGDNVDEELIWLVCLDLFLLRISILFALNTSINQFL